MKVHPSTVGVLVLCLLGFAGYHVLTSPKAKPVNQPDLSQLLVSSPPKELIAEYQAILATELKSREELDQRIPWLRGVIAALEDRLQQQGQPQRLPEVTPQQLPQQTPPGFILDIGPILEERRQPQAVPQEPEVPQVPPSQQPPRLPRPEDLKPPQVERTEAPTTETIEPEPVTQEVEQG